MHARAAGAVGASSSYGEDREFSPLLVQQATGAVYVGHGLHVQALYPSIR